MRRLLIMLLLGISAGLGACESPEFSAEGPLFVFNSYPANGVSVVRDDLTTLSVTFSDDVGPAPEVRGQVPDWFRLEDEVGGIEIVASEGTNVAYDPETFTLEVRLSEALTRGMSDGVYVLTVDRRWESTDGRRMPQDYVIRFRVVSR